MPCHVEIYKRNKPELVETLIEVVKGKISIKEVGDGYNCNWKSVKDHLATAKGKYKTFHYRFDERTGTLVIVSPCPKGC